MERQEGGGLGWRSNVPISRVELQGEGPQWFSYVSAGVGNPKELLSLTGSHLEN
jgi:hypothetical protein